MTSETWLKPVEVLKWLEPRSNEEAKFVIADRCFNGMLESRGQLIVVTYQNCKKEEWIDEDVGYALIDRGSSSRKNALIDQDFWSDFSADSTTRPPKGSTIMENLFWADWQTGDFGCQKIWDQPAGAEEELGIVRYEVVGLEFNGMQLADYASKRLNNKTSKVGRPDKYKWEQAIVGLTLEWAHGVFLLDAYEAHAQAKLEKALSNFLWSKFTEKPTESAIRPRAKGMLEAFQAEQDREAK